MRPVMETCSADDLSLERGQEMREWFREEFGHLPYRFAAREWYVLARHAHKLIGCVGIVNRTVRVGKQYVPVGGISYLVTHSEWRHQGIGSALLEEAITFIRGKLRYGFALLLCREDIVPFYAKFGWTQVEGPTHFSQPSGKLRWPKATMVFQCGERKWSTGSIDLCGLPW